MNILRAVLLKLTSALMFSVMAAFVRYVSDVTPLGEVVFCRSFFALLPVVIIYAWRGELAAADRGRHHDHVRLAADHGRAVRLDPEGARARLPLDRRRGRLHRRGRDAMAG